MLVYTSDTPVLGFTRLTALYLSFSYACRKFPVLHVFGRQHLDCTTLISCIEETRKTNSLPLVVFLDTPFLHFTQMLYEALNMKHAVHVAKLDENYHEEKPLWHFAGRTADIPRNTAPTEYEILFVGEQNAAFITLCYNFPESKVDTGFLHNSTKYRLKYFL